jgi:crotonobetainyl-CoA:carnitine CoA-transferase CaiB-like acyl-CoA transferase
MAGTDSTGQGPGAAGLAPLRELRVVELGNGVAAMFCGLVLRWLGAAVERWEQAGAGPLAQWSVGDDHFGQAVYDYCCAAKQIVEVPQVSGALSRLAGADIFVTDWPARALAAAGAGPDELSARHPSLIVVSVTGYGLSGPNSGRPSSELTVYHSGGEGYLLPGGEAYAQFPDRPPVRGGRFLASYDSGLTAATGALAAVLRRERDGRGDVVEVSEQEVQVSLNRTVLSECFASGRDLHRADRGYPYGGILPALDGWVSVRPTEDAQWRSFARGIGRPELASDPEFATREARDRHGSRLNVVLADWTRSRSQEEIRTVLAAADCPGGPFLEIGQVLADPALAPRELFVPHPQGGRAPGRLFQADSAVQLDPRPCGLAADGPGTGGAATGHTADAGQASAPEARGGTGPLAGVRVLDLSSVIAGPYGSAVLAMLGAEVVKIESRDRPDLYRRLATRIPGDLDSAVRFVDLNQGKRSVCLDLKTERGRELLLGLAGQADVLLDNFRPGVRDRLGIGDEPLHQANPRLVLAGLSGFGRSGPMRSRPGYASVFNAESGLGAMTGYPDGSPSEIRDSNDLRAGMAAACAILAGLVERARHHRAVSIDVAAREALIALAGDAILEASRGSAPTRSANALGRLVPHGCWLAADGRWVAVSVPADCAWADFAGALGAGGPGSGDLARPELADPVVRWSRRGEVEDAVARRIMAMPGAEVADRLQAAGFAASVSMTATDLHHDPHLNARGMFRPATHSKLGDVTLIGPPVRFHRDPGPVPCGPGPLLGQHDDEVLAAAGRPLAGTGIRSGPGDAG